MAETDGPFARERMLGVAGAALLFAAAYFGSAHLAQGAETTWSPELPVDQWIPFWAPAVLAYAWAYPAALLPIFVVRSRRYFWRVVSGYLAAILIATVCFIALPIGSGELRIPVERLDPSHFGPWFLRWIYATDPPFNLFPSLHVGLVALSALACRRVDARLGTALLAALGAVAFSVSLTKQHYVADTVSGLALAFALDAIIVGRHFLPADARAMPPPVTRRYLTGIALAYVAVFMAFLLGVPAP